MTDRRPTTGRDDSLLDAWIDGAFPGNSRLAAGAVVGDFELVRPLGSGGMGEVWEARQLSLGRRRVALKVLRVKCGGANELESFRREARAASRVAHAGLVAVYGHDEAAGQPFLAMELIEGGRTLRDWIHERVERPELSPDHDRAVAGKVATIAEALHACHGAGIVHRDLKPANVLLTSVDEPKVTDFGVARLTDEPGLTRTGDRPGTCAYMSPEQLSGERVPLDGRSDIFSLGVVLYELLALRRPFAGDTTAQVTRQILHEEPLPLHALRSLVPRDLAVICARAMEKEPARRYASMDELAADLRRFLAHEPIHARPPGPVERALKWARRHPTRSLVGATVVVAFAVISVLLAQNVTARRELAREVEAVQRLSAMQELETLVAEADDLELMWPIEPEKIPIYEAWIRRAEALVVELPAHRTQLAELQAFALPRSEAELAREREMHPSTPRLRELEEDLAGAELRLHTRLTGEYEEPPPFDRRMFPHDTTTLLSIAEIYADATRPKSRWNQLCLTLVARVLDERPGTEDWVAEHHLARALLKLSRYDDARMASRRSVARAPEEHRARAIQDDEELSRMLESERSESKLFEARAEISGLEQDVAALRAQIDVDVELRFPPEVALTRWWHREQRQLIEGLESLVDERTGLGSSEGLSPDHGWSVGRRLAHAQRLKGSWGPNGEFTARWARALPVIRERYGLPWLEPQLGLVPLGPDPGSGLWEFWHVASGGEPEFTGENGTRLAPRSGLVFVLLPGGESWMGAQGTDPFAPNYDPQTPRRDGDEGPVQRVVLAPFLLSKYELTVGQWRELTGGSPSYWTTFSDHGPEDGLLRPVERVNWRACAELARKFELDIPTEAQWEYACRAGEEGPFDDLDCSSELGRFANVADRSHGERFGASLNTANEDFDDGFGEHTQVGSLLPNSFGLHDMRGNVFEWCRDLYASYQQAVRRGDGLRPSMATTAFRVRRGGSYESRAFGVRSAFRDNVHETHTSAIQGFRPARSIDGAP